MGTEDSHEATHARHSRESDDPSADLGLRSTGKDTVRLFALPFLSISMLHATRRVALRMRERVCEANLCACALACCALRFMTETPPRHVQNYSAVALPYRPPRHANDIGSGYMHAAASPREAGGAGSMNAAAIGQLLGS